MGYTRDAVKGVSWITLLRVFTRALTFVRLAILGRILTPLQFGYFGIATLVLALLEIITETGINVFLVQERSNIKEYINSAWVVSIIRGVILAIFITIGAPYIAGYFNASGALNLLYFMALVPLIRGFINPAIIVYQKELMFKNEFKLRFVLFITDTLISIIAGFITRDALCFVYGLIASAFLEVFLSYYLLPVKPSFILEGSKIKKIINRGKWVTVTGIFSYIADNGDNFAVGKLLGTSALGIYGVAYKFSTLSISEITNVVNQVVFPVYTKFANDKERLKKALTKVTIVTSSGAILIGTLIYFLADYIILFIMGDQWVDAVPVIKILALFGILRTIFGSFTPLFLAVGKQDYAARMLFFRVIGLLITIIPFIGIYGLQGAAYAMIVSVLVEIPFVIYYTYKVLK